MSEDDRAHWDPRWAEAGAAPTTVEMPPHLVDVDDLLPRRGTALEIACGRGRGVAWLGRRGLTVVGVDVSPVAIDLARTHVDAVGLGGRCELAVYDLDGGLPPGDPVDLVLCHLFRDPALDAEMITRLAPGGTLAVVCLSEVGHGPGRFREPAGALLTAFGELTVLDHTEADGVARFVGRAQ